MIICEFLDKVNVNEATIVESEVFVYNLGTMFYIDRVLFTNANSLPVTTVLDEMSTTITSSDLFTTAFEAESVLQENGAMPDVLVADEETATESTTVKNETVK